MSHSDSDLILAVDLGTSGARAGAFDRRGRLVDRAEVGYRPRAAAGLGRAGSGRLVGGVPAGDRRGDRPDRARSGGATLLRRIGAGTDLPRRRRAPGPAVSDLVRYPGEGGACGAGGTLAAGPGPDVAPPARLDAPARTRSVSAHATGPPVIRIPRLPADGDRRGDRRRGSRGRAHRLDALGLDPAQRPETVRCPGDLIGALSPRVAAEVGLPAGLPVIAGTVDCFATWIGTGTIRAGRSASPPARPAASRSSATVGSPTREGGWGRCPTSSGIDGSWPDRCPAAATWWPGSPGNSTETSPTRSQALAGRGRDPRGRGRVDRAAVPRRRAHPSTTRTPAWSSSASARRTRGPTSRGRSSNPSPSRSSISARSCGRSAHGRRGAPGGPRGTQHHLESHPGRHPGPAGPDPRSGGLRPAGGGRPRRAGGPACSTTSRPQSTPWSGSGTSSSRTNGAFLLSPRLPLFRDLYHRLIPLFRHHEPADSLTVSSSERERGRS